MTSFDGHANLALASVAIAPSPASSGTSLTLAAGQGASMPSAPFNATVWPAVTVAQPVPVLSDAEIVRVTGVAGDVLTIVRRQEGSSPRSIVVGDQLAVTITAKSLTDIESAVTTNTTAISTETTRATAAEATLVPLSQKGAVSGVGSLDSSGRQPIGQAPVSVGFVSPSGHTNPLLNNGYIQLSAIADGPAYADGQGGFAYRSTGEKFADPAWVWRGNGYVFEIADSDVAPYWALVISGEDSTGGNAGAGYVGVGIGSGDTVPYPATWLHIRNAGAVGKHIRLDTNGSGAPYVEIGWDGSGLTISQPITGPQDIAGTLRATGQTNPAGGAGVEVLYSGGQGYIQAYDRSGSALKPMLIQANGLHLSGGSGSDLITLSGSTLSFFAGAGAAKQAITGALSSVTDANAKAVLTSILAALATNYGLVTNSTT